MNKPPRGTYTIWIEAEQWAPGEWTPADDNSDVIVTFENGDRWVASFFSYRNIWSLAKKNRGTGENLGGKYFVATDMILVDVITRPRIEEVVADLIKEGDFTTYFTSGADDAAGTALPPEAFDPIYLCAMDDIVGPEEDEASTARLGMLATLLSKLGFQLISGEAPAYHELWARRVSLIGQIVVGPPPPGTDAPPWRDDAATDFERRFLAWLHVAFGIVPTPKQGTNSEWWTFEYRNQTVAFVVVGQRKNTSAPADREIAWLLRMEEPLPGAFIALVERHFRPASGVRRYMAKDTIRIQFKSTDLVFPFADQADST